ncbi:hypothetical protein M153_5580001919 [Pseudoloma neurophilia]|uniref:CBF1-interacting co-repressor CIR N-terminal domain-containing protein n=1 Tax=Pseudoloma neurophilia TaxID=146866 RepID=A0A0R0M2H7_9MICR|nr:hypothetical protein M153_5580001919 [Pseudoloma neurophilia]
MTKNTNCKKSWHPTRFEHKEKIEKFKKQQDDKKRAKRIKLMKKVQDEQQGNKLKRFEWMYF